VSVYIYARVIGAAVTKQPDHSPKQVGVDGGTVEIENA
jgi:hypothetical protein